MSEGTKARQVAAAGLIAAVVIACGDAAMEGAGQMMSDAGEWMSEAGAGLRDGDAGGAERGRVDR